MAEKDLSTLFLDTLSDIYYAEKQIYKSLPKMAKAAVRRRARPSKTSRRAPKAKSSVSRRSSRCW